MGPQRVVARRVGAQHSELSEGQEGRSKEGGGSKGGGRSPTFRAFLVFLLLQFRFFFSSLGSFLMECSWNLGGFVGASDAREPSTCTMGLSGHCETPAAPRKERSTEERSRGPNLHPEDCGPRAWLVESSPPELESIWRLGSVLLFAV